MNKNLLPVTLAILAAAAFALPAQAQRRGGLGFRGANRGFAHVRRPGGYFLGSAFGPYFYPDYESDFADEAPLEIVQVPEPSAPAPERKPAESLMIELQGDHWVRITNYGESQIDEQSGVAEAKRESNAGFASRRTEPVVAQAELPAAVLVFRDGRTEEVKKYMIVGTTIYTGQDYWSTGSWTQKVQIAELNIPETLKLNLDRGTRFSLPSGPNEVMIRP
jgi:hypothetical protein